MDNTNYKTVEALAALEHEQWAHWTKYMLDTLQPFLNGHPDSHLIIGRWLRQIDTPYADLSEQEKESDRVWARKALEAVGRFPGDDVITMDEWQWVGNLLDQYPDEWDEDQWVEFNERAESRFGVEKWQEIRAIIDVFLGNDDG